MNANAELRNSALVIDPESAVGAGSRKYSAWSASSPGVSWAAVLGGAAVAAALSLILLALGAGFGLSTVSPWSGVGVSASTVGSMAIVWLVLTQIIAFSMGGYLTGRLRTRWHAIHTDEVHFRDTANGFLAWAVALIATVVFLAGAAVSMTGGIAAGAGPMATNAAPTDHSPDVYFVNRLFRSEHPAGENNTARRAEAEGILAHATLQSDMPAADTAYLSQLVAAGTGLNPNDAQQRVSDTMTDIRQAEDTTRKATAHVLLWIFLALLTGAFCASFAATIGGRQRDHVQVI
ncbi:MAG: hypothetical protein ABI824_07890 [Acidobacteriota bacterium]